MHVRRQHRRNPGEWNVFPDAPFLSVSIDAEGIGVFGWFSRGRYKSLLEDRMACFGGRKRHCALQMQGRGDILTPLSLQPSIHPSVSLNAHLPPSSPLSTSLSSLTSLSPTLLSPWIPNLTGSDSALGLWCRHCYAFCHKVPKRA